MNEEFNALDHLNPQRKVELIAQNTMRKRRVQELTNAYRNAFPEGSSALAVVMEDLAEFCCYNETVYIKSDDPRDVHIKEGRRQVYLRMKAYIEGAIR